MLQCSLQTTCKLSVTVSPAAKLSDEFPAGLEDENRTGLVVHNDNVTVLIHRYTFWAHQPSWAQLSLQKSQNIVMLIKLKFISRDNS